MENSKKEGSNTGYKGISFVKAKGKFRAVIALGRRHDYHHIGYYETLREAVAAREEFIKNLF